MSDTPPPIIKSLIICTEATKTEFGATNLMNVGMLFGATRFPASVPIVLYMQVTELYQPAAFRVEVADAETDFVGMQADIPPLSAPTPHSVVTDLMRFPDFEIPKPGDYLVRVMLDGITLADVRLTFFQTDHRR